MELADVTDSKSVDGDIVWVRVPPPAPAKKGDAKHLPFLLLLVGENPHSSSKQRQNLVFVGAA